MDVYPKYIVVNDSEEGICMVIGKVTYHRELLWDKDAKDQVIGGGWWRTNKNMSEMTFHGDSDDFGSVPEEILEEVIKNDKVFLSFPGGHKLDKIEKYFIDRQSEIVEVKVG